MSDNGNAKPPSGDGFDKEQWFFGDEGASPSRQPATRNLNVYTPLILSFVLMIGMQLGYKMYETVKGKPRVTQASTIREVEEVFNFIDGRYVDDVHSSDLVEKVIKETLEELDPHSSYISPDELEEVRESLKGEFDGIGVEFALVEDTIMVVATIAGGPSEQVGIRAGDKIIEIGDSLVAGVGITTGQIMKKLRGVKGSKVKVGVYRSGTGQMLPFTITRDKIPLYSVDVSYMMDGEIGYIKVNRFSEETSKEFAAALAKLKEEGMKSLILDLRHNPGGLLDAAVNMADEFIGGRDVLVYTEGKNEARKDHNARISGGFENGKLVVLVDEGSASASEIVAGAVQDYDRGVLVGKRSFGKGLVQEQYNLSNGGALRLTVARYHTPSGRCIQKPYGDGMFAYNHETENRTAAGDSLYAEGRADSSQTFKTLIEKRNVYGGGGISPDVYVPDDTTRQEAFSIKARSLAPEFAYGWYANHAQFYKQYENFADYNASYQPDAALFAAFEAYLKAQIGFVDEKLLLRDKSELLTYIKAYIARQLWHNEGYYPIINRLDNTLAVAVQEAAKR